MQQHRGGNTERKREKKLVSRVGQADRFVAIQARMNFSGNEVLIARAGRKLVSLSALEGL
jgi:hypothetical protein